MSLFAHSHRRPVAALAFLVGWLLLPSAAPPFVGAQAIAQTAPSGTAAEVAIAIAEMQRIGGIIQNFPQAPRYYDVAPCHPVAASELALLNRWNANFQSAAAKFDAAVNAYAAEWRTRTGAAGRSELAGATPPAAYQRQGQQLKSRTAQAHQAKAAGIRARTRVCPVQGGDGLPPIGWGGTTTTTAPPTPTPQPQAPTPPAENPPTQDPPGPPAEDVNPESLGLVSPIYEWGERPEVPQCFTNEAQREALLRALEDAHRKANANHAAVSGFLERINAVIESYGQRPVPSSLLGLQQAARRNRDDFYDYANKIFADLQEARSRPLCPPSQAGGVGTVPSGTGTVPAPPSEQAPSGETPDERQSRLKAIDKLRTGDANRSGTGVAPVLPGTRDPSRDVREDVEDRMHEAERERRRNAAAQSLEQEPGGQPTKPGTPPAANPPPAENVPSREELPPGTAQPLSETQPQTSGSGASNQAPTEAKPPGKRPPRSRTRPRRPGPPVEPPPPVVEPEPKEDILEDLDEFGAAGDLAYDNPLFDRLTVEFNKAARECDLKAFLEVRKRYLTELRRILSNPNLNARAREHFERILNAVLETTPPVRAPLPCPVLIR